MITSPNIRKNILIPLSITILVLISMGAVSIYWVQNSHLEKEVIQESGHLTEIYHALIEEESEHFQSLLELVTHNEEFKQAWNEKDRDLLLQAVKPTYSRLSANHRVTHFYFHDLDGRVFLRMHKPNRYGDLIQRQTLKDAMRTKQVSSGLELGLFGSLVLRVVQPWYVNDELVGYVELGEEIDFIAPQLVNIMDFVIFVTLNKSLLNYEDWQNFQKNKRNPADWKLYTDRLISYQSIKDVPTEIHHYYASTKISDTQVDWDIDHKNSSYQGRSLILRDISGRVVGELLFLADITEMKISLNNTILTIVIVGSLLSILILAGFYQYLGKIERQILHSNNALETEINKRKSTAETLSLRGKELEASNKELESYSYSIAHDLRTPLRSIVSFSQILLEDVGDKISQDEKSILLRIISAAKRMADLINDILELSQITRDNMKISRVDLSELAGTAAQLLCDSNKKYKVKFNIHENITAMGDERLLRMVIDNLIENACKYSANVEDAVIEFNCIRKNTRPVYYIKDNGIGLDMEYASKIFKPFHRLHRADEYEGTGIGLATVERIIQRHGGRIWLESEPNKGSIFYFELGT